MCISRVTKDDVAYSLLLQEGLVLPLRQKGSSSEDYKRDEKPIK